MTTYSTNISITGIYYRIGAGGATSITPGTDPIHAPFGSTVMLQLEADGIGDYENSSLTGTFTQGSFVITNVPTPAAYGVVPGCVLTGLGGVGIGTCLPNGPTYLVTAVGTSSITFVSLSGGGYGTIPAQATANNVPFNVIDAYPYGYLEVSVSPSSGLALADYNFDGTMNSGNMGNGLAISNYAGQGVGNVALTFDQTGTFNVSVEFVSGDANYVNTTASDLITIIVP